MNAMIDIETLRLRPLHKVPVLSVGIVVFDGGGRPQAEHAIYIDWDTWPEELEACEETVKWWNDQDHWPTLVHLISRLGVPFEEAMQDLREFYLRWEIESVWAAGPQFDITVLENCFDLAEVEIPWNFSDVRDFRTIRKQYPGIAGRTVREGPLHDEIADCKHQIAVLRDIHRVTKKPWK